MIPKPGIYENVPFAEYRSWDAFSQSMVTSTLRSGLHLQTYLTTERKPSDAQRLGSLVDCLVLEPELFDEYFIEQPATYQTEVSKGRGADKHAEIVTKPWSLRSNTCKEIQANIIASGKTPVSTAEIAKSKLMTENVMANKNAAEWVNQGKKQLSIVWTDDDTGVLCKGRLDIFCESFVVDLKTTQDASEQAFPFAISKWGYHVQGAMYSDGMAALTDGTQMPYEFIVVESSEPYAVAVYDLEPDALLAGRSKYKRALAKYAEYKASGQFPGYSSFVEPISIPYWEIKKEIGDMNHEQF